MLRHILGEDLNVGCVLSWGPCWYTQKQYFEGKTSALSRENYLMRYDVEVSGFPSSHAGHLCLLRLTEDDYPGTTLLEEWPSWTLSRAEVGQGARRSRRLLTLRLGTGVAGLRSQRRADPRQGQGRPSG